MTQEEPQHPDYGEVEAYRQGNADAAMTEHMAHCHECQAALAELQEIAELLRHKAPVPPMPDHLKQQLLWNARKEAARVRRELRMAQIQRPPSPRLRRTSWAIAAVVVLSLGALVVWRQMGSRSEAGLDAVDALLLARGLAAAEPVDARFDVNGDGKVDGRDVEGTLRQVVSLLVAPAVAQELPGEVKYRRVEIFIDAGSAGLAAYQVEITTTGDARIGGIIGGEHAAFKEPAFYDPAALWGDGRKIILAAISTAADLPHGRTRVAALSMREAGEVTYRIRLMAAARADGTRFEPPVSVVPGPAR